MTADVVVFGGELLTPTGRRRRDLLIRDGRIASLDLDADDAARRDLGTLDASGLVVAPGLIDLQCNGAGGIDLTAEPERLWEMAALLPRWGVTAWLPTIVTSPADVRRRALAALADRPAGDRLLSQPAPPASPRPASPSSGRPVLVGSAVTGDGWPSVPATPLGLHFEGPFLAPERRGAHAPAHLLEPDLGLVDGWSAQAGVAMVTLAPELPGALQLVAELTRRGVVVSLGHTSATAAEARAAVGAGARSATHLFSAMAPLHHREPGLVGLALTDERLTVGLIADGVHVDPTVVRLVAEALGPRLALVTDAVAALAAPPLHGDEEDKGLRRPRADPAAPGTGQPGHRMEGSSWPRTEVAAAARGDDTGSGQDLPPHAARNSVRPVRLGDMEAFTDGRSVRLADGTLAGSVLSLDQAVGNLMAFAGLGLEEAVRAATETPARLLGAAAERGVLAPGAAGDVVLLDVGGVGDSHGDGAGDGDHGPGGARPEVVATVIGGVVAYDRRVDGAVAGEP